MIKEKYINKSTLSLILALLLSACNTTEPVIKQEPVYGKSIAAIVEMMTLEEKVGQMTQVDRGRLNKISDIKTYFLGSVLSGGGSSPEINSPTAWADMVDAYQLEASQTRLGIPLMYGIDAIHGHNNVYGATIFPHNIGLGATGNPDLAEEIARITAKEVRATGINWTFDPCVANSRDERWGRSYESYGEDPALISALGRAQVAGYQGRSLSSSESIAACTKHYIGDGAPTWGTGVAGNIDQGDAQISEAELRALHFPPYQAAIQAGTATIMASYNSWNGEKLHGHEYLMTDVLKGELGFEGFIVSDWQAIDQLPGSYKSDIVQSINAGIDMVMVPGNGSNGAPGYTEFIRKLKQAVNEGLIETSRIDDAVTRILRVKQNMGLLDGPYINDRSLITSIGSAEHRAVARQAVRESVVMLKNENLLPLSRDLSKVIITGRGAHNIGMQCGGWSIHWQGGMGDITEGTTILEGIVSSVSSSTQIEYSTDGAILAGADAIIVVVGEEPYAEGAGDRANLILSSEDLTLINRVEASGQPYVVVLLSGRPLIITDIIENADAFLAAWLPGTEGNGISDVIFGDYVPTGKLSVTWPRNMAQIPINLGDSGYDPLFPVGFGLSY